MSKPKQEGILLGFYGDDFTGSTDAMEALSRSGLRTILFIRPPTAEQLGGYEGLRAVGLAGCSRSLSPAEMDIELTVAFGALQALRPPIVHYKICSTFDSSPQIGSIGRALEIGAEMFRTPVVPVVVGASVLGRYCVFGNLFARSGQDSEPYRLDRHPTMSRHPITPMVEGDLRLHLAGQTDRKIGLLDILSVVDTERAHAKYRQLVEAGAQVVLIDSIYPGHERVIGKFLSGQIRDGATLFVVGSSGVEYALTAEWQSRETPSPLPSFSAAPVESLIVVSGSCSPVTDRQIAWAVRQGAAEIEVRTAELVESASAEREIERTIAAALKSSGSGRTVICHTARGPDDPRRDETARRFEAHGRNARQHSGKLLGEALGRVLAEVLRRGKVQRAVVTGGDTSFHVARQLGMEALEMIAPVAPGCPLCRAHIPGSPLDGMEICFKGGQVGKEDFFGTVLDPGKAAIDSFDSRA
jgi:3-oxoisoapionate kinase